MLELSFVSPSIEAFSALSIRGENDMTCTYRVRPKVCPGMGVRLCVGEPLEAKRLPTCTGTTRRLWGWLGQAWVASSELEL